MLGIILIIVICVICYVVFTGSIDNKMNKMGLNDKEKDNVWWTIGMLSDIRNKNKGK